MRGGEENAGVCWPRNDVGGWNVTETAAEAPARPRRQRGASAYQRWKQGEGIPAHTGSYVDDMNTVEVGPWARFGEGQRGAFVSLGDQARGDGRYVPAALGRIYHKRH